MSNIHNVIADYITALTMYDECITIIEFGNDDGRLFEYVASDDVCYMGISQSNDVDRLLEEYPDALFVSGNYNDDELLCSLPRLADVAVCINKLQNELHPTTLINNLIASTVSGGHVIITVPNGEHDDSLHCWTQSELVDFLRPFGLMDCFTCCNDVFLIAGLDIT